MTVLRAAGAEVLQSVTFSTLIIVLVFCRYCSSPVWKDSSSDRWMAYLLIFGASLLVALTVTPVLCLLLFSRSRRIRKGQNEKAKVDGLW